MDSRLKFILQSKKHNITLNNDIIYYFIEPNLYKHTMLWPYLDEESFDSYEVDYTTWLNNSLELFESEKLYDLITDMYREGDSHDNYNYLTKNRFLDFFKEHNIDTPTCFSKSDSLRRPRNELQLIKFNNYIMRKGKKWYYLKIFLKVMFDLFYKYSFLKEKTLNFFNWKSLYHFYSNLFLFNKKYYPYNASSYANLPFNKKITNFELMYDQSSSSIIKSFLIQNLEKITPLFIYYIYKVAKLIYKNTRGKIGRYTYIWKYVAPYKRLFLVKYWIMKEIKARPGRKLNNRIYATFKDLIFNPKTLLIYRVKRFSNIYVYKYNRYSLAETYYTSTK